MEVEVEVRIGIKDFEVFARQSYSKEQFSIVPKNIIF